MSALLEHIGSSLSPEWDFEYACCREAILFTNVLYGIGLVSVSLLFLLYIYIVARNKTLHANFRVILLILAANDMALVYHRLADFWLTGRIDRENGFTYFIKMNCWAMLIVSLLNVIGERSFALYAYQWYHDAYLHFPAPLITIYIIQELCAGLLIWNGVLSKTLLVDCLVVTVFLTMLFLICIYRISRRRHRQMIATRFQWRDENLSRRLRTMEILRELHLLQRFLPYLIITSLVQMLEAAFVLHVITPIDHRYYLVAHCLFYLTIVIRVQFDLLIPMLAHPIIKADAIKTLRSLFQIVHRHRRNKVEVTPTPCTTRPASTVNSTNGKQLSFSPEQEKEMYFASYKQLWGSPTETAVSSDKQREHYVR